MWRVEAMLLVFLLVISLILNWEVRYLHRTILKYKRYKVNTSEISYPNNSNMIFAFTHDWF